MLPRAAAVASIQVLQRACARGSHVLFKIKTTLLLLQVVKTQLQGSAVKRGSNAFSIASSIFKNDGPRGKDIRAPRLEYSSPE